MKKAIAVFSLVIAVIGFGVIALPQKSEAGFNFSIGIGYTTPYYDYGNYGNYGNTYNNYGYGAGYYSGYHPVYAWSNPYYGYSGGYDYYDSYTYTSNYGYGSSNYTSPYSYGNTINCYGHC